MKLGQKQSKFDFELLESFAQTRNFSIQQKKCDGIILKCTEGHKVCIKYKDPLKSLDCIKCHKRLMKCIKHATLNNGKVISSYYSPEITFERMQGHQWKFKYGKTLFTHWCPHCERISQEERKNALKEETENNIKEMIREQNRKLEEARLHMEREQTMKPKNYQEAFCQCNFNSNASMLTDASINKLSEELSLKYIRENDSNLRINMEDIYLMYKILITPKESLISKLRIIPKLELCSFYRKCASKLHPDKNRHPRASEAFQKLIECYRQCYVKISS